MELPMFLRIDHLQVEPPRPTKADPNAAANLQELLGAAAFTPDYQPEEIFEITTKLYKASKS
jgi:hypothetical protein